MADQDPVKKPGAPEATPVQPGAEDVVEADKAKIGAADASKAAAPAPAKPAVTTAAEKPAAVTAAGAAGGAAAAAAANANAASKAGTTGTMPAAATPGAPVPPAAKPVASATPATPAAKPAVPAPAATAAAKPAAPAASATAAAAAPPEPEGPPKVKPKKHTQRACDEKDAKGKLCCGHLKRWYDYPKDIEALIGKKAEIYRCEFCKTLYKPDHASAPHSFTLRY